MFPLSSLPALIASRSCRFPLRKHESQRCSPAQKNVTVLRFALLTLLLLLPAPSWAGHWNVVFSGIGSSTLVNTTVTCTITDSVVTNADPNPYAPPLAVFGPGSGAPGSTVAINGRYYPGIPSLTVTAKLVWQPDASQDTSLPPPTVDVLEIGSASSSQYLVNPTGVVASATDGLNDSPVSQVAPMYGYTSIGRHLRHLTVPAGQRFVVLPDTVTLSASISYATSQGGSGPNTAVGYTVQIDSREVSITADCDTPTYTYYKLLSGGLDTNGDGNVARMQHIPAEMKGDIGIPYGEQHTTTGVDAQGHATSTFFSTPSNKTVTYKGHISGNWATENSQYLWNSSLKNYSTSGSLYHLNGIGFPTESEIPVLTNVYVGAVVNSDNGKIISNDVGPSGSSDHIFFKFTNGDDRPSYPTGNDGDGAVATANYYLTIHQPIEAFPSHRPDETNHYLIAAPSGGDIPMSFQGLDYSTYKGSGSNGLSAICVLNSPSVSWSLANDVTNALSSVPYPGYWGVLDVIFSGANIYINHATPQSMNFPADFNDVAWSDPQSTGDSYYSAKTYSKTYFHMSPRIRVQYRWRYKLVDVYNASGFQSETLSHDTEYIGPQNAFGVFTYDGP